MSYKAYKPTSQYNPKDLSDINQRPAEVVQTLTDLKTEFSQQLTSIEMGSVNKAATMTFSYNFTTFKIKNIIFSLVESPNAAGTCELTGVNITCNGTYLLYKGSFASINSGNPDRKEYVGFLLDVIANGILTIQITGTPVDTAGIMTVTVEGFQLDYNKTIA